MAVDIFVKEENERGRGWVQKEKSREGEVVACKELDEISV